MKFKPLVTITTLLLSLIIQTAQSTPLDNECTTSHPTVVDCSNDPFVTTSYEIDYMNFGRAWDKSYGTARIGIVDTPINLSSLNNDFRPIRSHDSGQYACHPPGSFTHFNEERKCVTQATVFNYDWFFSATGVFMGSTVSNHGDLIFSLFGSNPDNGIGMSSICRDCSLALYGAYVVNLTSEPSRTDYSAYYNYMEIKNRNQYRAMSNAIMSGNQIINKSGFFGPIAFENCNFQESRGNKQSLCYSLEAAKELDVIVIASNGNDLTGSANWPANETDSVIGVGGSDIQGRIWDDLENQGSCPLPFVIPGTNPPQICDPSQGYCPTNRQECGSQLTGISGNILAPAKDVTVFHGNASYNTSTGCIDGDGDGYQTCSGTSFSAPIISGIVAIMRSLNPLLSFDEVKFILENSRVTTDSQGRTYSIPNAASIIKKDILGQINGVKIMNRLKPMFRLHHTYNYQGEPKVDYLSTTIPQLASASWRRQYLSDVDTSSGFLKTGLTYRTDNTEPLALGYPRFRQPNMNNYGNNARAPFYIFGGHENPFTGADDMIPLYHFALKEVDTNDPRCYDQADHAYGTFYVTAFSQRTNVRCNHGVDTSYVKEGIEGYLLPTCPEGPDGCYENTGNANAPQCLMLRYSDVDNSYALLMESELNKAKFSTYTGTADHLIFMDDAECLGYAYPNVDSDGDLVLDGMELILGTNPLDPDSDNDGLLDGEEYPPTSPVVSDPLIAN